MKSVRQPPTVVRDAGQALSPEMVRNAHPTKDFHREDMNLPDHSGSDAKELFEQRLME
jgi:hypothetical protein